MTAYGTEFFSMNDVNRFRVSQDVIDRHLTIRLTATRFHTPDDYYLTIGNAGRFHLLTVIMTSLATDAGLSERVLHFIHEYSGLSLR